MTENNELLDFWMQRGRLYSRIESRYGFRLSCGEKMLLKTYIDWTNQTDITMPPIASREFLENFGFDSETFRLYNKEIGEHAKGAISEFEFRGKQGRNKK